MTLFLNSVKCLLNLCKLFKISSLCEAVGVTPLVSKGEFNIGIVGRLFFLLILGLAAGWVSVDNGRETAGQLKPLRNLNSPSFISLEGRTVLNIL